METARLPAFPKYDHDNAVLALCRCRFEAGKTWLHRPTGRVYIRARSDAFTYDTRAGALISLLILGKSYEERKSLLVGLFRSNRTGSDRPMPSSVSLLPSEILAKLGAF